ncbi:hypothetical protein, partial [Lacticaseibacillus rhamnosus]|uniref:hypothetical protein n=1 Tax=Lacticaseibacillus rhamnosus TaxID=47715 RepID=UPI00157DD986
ESVFFFLKNKKKNSPAGKLIFKPNHKKTHKNKKKPFAPNQKKVLILVGKVGCEKSNKVTKPQNDLHKSKDRQHFQKQQINKK